MIWAAMAMAAEPAAVWYIEEPWTGPTVRVVLYDDGTVISGPRSPHPTGPWYLTGRVAPERLAEILASVDDALRGHDGAFVYGGSHCNDCEVYDVIQRFGGSPAQATCLWCLDEWFASARSALVRFDGTLWYLWAEGALPSLTVGGPISAPR